MEQKLTFDDVLIRPRYSTLSSRAQADTSSASYISPTLHLPQRTPMFSAAMDTITEVDMACALDGAAGVGVIHRFQSTEARYQMTRRLGSIGCVFGVAVGLDDDILDIIFLINNGATFIVLDVANGYTQDARDAVARIAALHHDDAVKPFILVAGNIATPGGAWRLWTAGADIVKVGIGSGGVCSTRTVSAVGYPQLSAIMDIHNAHPEIPLISDGGVREPADFVKALGAGADGVMMGSMFAGTDETPVDTHGDACRFRGMASEEAATDNGKTYYTAEGVSIMVPSRGPVGDIIDQLDAGLRSAMSYVGAYTLDQFRDRCEFVRVSSATITENDTLSGC